MLGQLNQGQVRASQPAAALGRAAQREDAGQQVQTLTETEDLQFLGILAVNRDCQVIVISYYRRPTPLQDAIINGQLRYG